MPSLCQWDLQLESMNPGVGRQLSTTSQPTSTGALPSKIPSSNRNNVKRKIKCLSHIEMLLVVSPAFSSELVFAKSIPGYNLRIKVFKTYSARTRKLIFGVAFNFRINTFVPIYLHIDYFYTLSAVFKCLVQPFSYYYIVAILSW